MSEQQPKINIHQIRGWSNDQAQIDQEILTKILKKKQAPSNLPTLKPLKAIPLQKSTQKTKKQSQPLFSIEKPSPNIPIKEGLDLNRDEQILCSRYTRSPLKQKLEQINNEEDESFNLPTIITPRKEDSPNLFEPENLHTHTKSQSRLDNHGNVTPLKVRLRTIDPKHGSVNYTKIFKRYDIEQRMKQPSPEQGNKTYLKLNTLILSTHIKKKLKNSSPVTRDIQNHVCQISTYKERTQKSGKKLQKAQRASERLKQTFIKQDIFTRQKRKKHKMQRLIEAVEFNDQDIFNYNNSISSISRGTPLLQKQSTNPHLNFGKASMRYKMFLY